jgi:hypothetical protein
MAMFQLPPLVQNSPPPSHPRLLPSHQTRYHQSGTAKLPEPVIAQVCHTDPAISQSQNGGIHQRDRLHEKLHIKKPPRINILNGFPTNSIYNLAHHLPLGHTSNTSIHQAPRKEARQPPFLETQNRAKYHTRNHR